MPTFWVLDVIKATIGIIIVKHDQIINLTRIDSLSVGKMCRLYLSINIQFGIHVVLLESRLTSA